MSGSQSENQTRAYLYPKPKKRGAMLDKQEKIDRQMAKARKVRIANLANKGKGTYLNRSWLFSRRCIDKMSLDKIAELCRVEYDVIWDSLKKLDIPIIIMVGRENWLDWVEKHEKKIAYRKI